MHHVDGREELARVLMLFCEAQCARNVIVSLVQANGPVNRLRALMDAGLTIQLRPEEPDGEVYDEARFARLAGLISARLGEEEDSDQPG